MNQVIIYQNDEGGVAIVRPTQEGIDLLGIDGVAQKDVPTGKPYLIVDAATLPDREYRDAWEVDPAVLTSGVGA